MADGRTGSIKRGVVFLPFLVDEGSWALFSLNPPRCLTLNSTLVEKCANRPLILLRLLLEPDLLGLLPAWNASASRTVAFVSDLL